MEPAPITPLLLAVLAPVTAGLATLLLPLKWTTVRPLLALAGPAVAFALVILHLSTHGIEPISPHTRGTQVLPWIPLLHLDLAFLADGLGVFFALLVSGVGSLIVLYARGYFGPCERDLFRFYPTLGFFTTAMMGVVLSDYTLLTLLFWEMTSISSFLLIGWDRYDKKAVKLAMQAFFTTGLGGMGLFGGVLLFGESTGIWRWSELLSHAAEIDLTAPAVVASFILMFIGAGTKSAQWPFHYWLPGAMAAPTPVSAFLHSATMVKAGVFLMGRLFPAFGAVAVLDHGHVELLPGVPVWAGVIIPFGTVTMLVGGVLAVLQHDLKRIFAYTTVSQLGLLMTMYGLGGITFESHGHVYPAIDWDITQIANHAFYKAPLFIVAGAIGHVAGTRALPELFGYFKRDTTAKILTVVLLLAGYALAAGPFTVSFGAKELFLYQVYHATYASPWLWAVMAATVVMAACNVGIFVRLATTLLGHGRFGMKPPTQPDPLDETRRDSLHGTGPEHHKPEGEHHQDHHAAEYQYEERDDVHAGHEEHEHEHGPWAHMLWIPAAVLVAFQYLGGFVPPLWNWVFRPLEHHAWYFPDAPPSIYSALLNPLSPPLWFSLIGILLGAGLGLSRLGRGSHEDVNDRVYPGMYWLAVTGGGRVFRVVQTGRLRDYLLMSLGALLVGIAASAWYDAGMIRAVEVEWAKVLEFWPGALLGLLICATALSLPFTDLRIVRVILLGACGFSVVGMYVLYQAPDLALTQLMFEIISVILFVLVLRLLPPQKAAQGHGRWWRALAGGASGLALGWVTLVAASSIEGGIGATLGDFFAKHSYQGTALTDGRGGGGKNIVNVILVDFRGFDTLGEITVLALAVMGVWSLMPGSWSRRRTSESDATSRTASVTVHREGGTP